MWMVRARTTASARAWVPA